MVAGEEEGVSIVTFLENIHRAKSHADIYLALQDASTLLEASSTALYITNLSNHTVVSVSKIV